MSCKCLCVAFFVFPQKCACVFSFRNLSVSITKRRNIGHGSANWPKSTQNNPKTRKTVELHLLWKAHQVFKQNHVYSSTLQIDCSNLSNYPCNFFYVYLLFGNRVQGCSCSFTTSSDGKGHWESSLELTLHWYSIYWVYMPWRIHSMSGLVNYLT